MIRKLYKKSLVKIMIRCLIITFFVVVAGGELKSTAYAKENIMPIFRMTDNKVLDFLNIMKEKEESGEINLGVKAKGMWKLPDYEGEGYLYKIDLEDRGKSVLLIYLKNNHVETVSLDSTQYDMGNAINWFATILYGGKITQEKNNYINKCIMVAVRDYPKVVILEREGEKEWGVMAFFTEKKSINGDIKIRVEILAEVDTSDIDEYMKIREDVRDNIKRQYYALEREKSNLDTELIELKNKIRNGTIDDVEAEREKMRQDREYKAILMLKQGLAKWEKADYDGMINTNEEALKLNPKYAFAYNNCAVAHEAYGNLEEAFKKYDFATIINSSYAEPYYNRGNVYYKLEKLDEAIKEYKKAVECNPKFAQAYGNLGVVYGDLGEYDKSIECLEKALDIEEFNKTFMYNLIITRAKKEGKFSIEKIW